MKKYKTRKDEIAILFRKANHKLDDLEREKDEKQKELDSYVRRHRSLKFDGIETCDIKKLLKLYKFLDGKYPVDWEGGLRADDRGMKLCFWLADDPDFLVIHLTSTSQNICFSGSTSWIAKAPTLSDKVRTLKMIKKEALRIIKEV